VENIEYRMQIDYLSFFTNNARTLAYVHIFLYLCREFNNLHKYAKMAVNHLWRGICSNIETSVVLSTLETLKRIE